MFLYIDTRHNTCQSRYRYYDQRNFEGFHDVPRQRACER